MKSYYRMQFLHEYDEILYPLCKAISGFCMKSEFWFLPEKSLEWHVPADADFSFLHCYHIKEAVPVYSETLWNDIAGIIETDGIFTIPVTIRYRGEQHLYHIAVPSKIRCCDAHGHLTPRLTGRYAMFRPVSGSTVYITEALAGLFRKVSGLKLQGVDTIG